MGANLSTTVFLLALSITPAIVKAVLAHSTPSTSVAQTLHALDTKDGRN